MHYFKLCLVVLCLAGCSKNQEEAVLKEARSAAVQPDTLAVAPAVSEASSADAVSEDNQNTIPAFPTQSPGSEYSFKVIPAEGGTFGYEILNGQKPMIRQTGVPGMQGNSGFAEAAMAGKVAALVIEKLKKGEMPPTVSLEEIKALNVTP